MKLLLYCTKAKPYLRKLDNYFLDKKANKDYWKKGQVVPYSVNGKIVAECDFEVEEIACTKIDYARSYSTNGNGEVYYDNSIKLTYKPFYLGLNISNIALSKRSCLTNKEMYDYLQGESGYAIHIKNLHIFDKPKELRELYTNRIYTKIEDVYTDEVQIKCSEWVRPIKKAPQNMMCAYDEKGNKYVLISIQPQWLCKILNREKTIEVRKKVLKKVLKNE